jgi:hypothetical protein
MFGNRGDSTLLVRLLTGMAACDLNGQPSDQEIDEPAGGEADMGRESDGCAVRGASAAEREARHQTAVPRSGRRQTPVKPAAGRPAHIGVATVDGATGR